jgi:hypothetical protein
VRKVTAQRWRWLSSIWIFTAAGLPIGKDKSQNSRPQELPDPKGLQWQDSPTTSSSYRQEQSYKFQNGSVGRIGT